MDISQGHWPGSEIGTHTETRSWFKPTWRCFKPCHLEIKAGRLRWDLGPQPWRVVNPSAFTVETLLRFREIDETRPSSILRFAQRYGYLGVLSEAPRRNGGIFVKAADEYKSEYSVFRGVLAEAQSGSESVKDWYFWTREFRLVLSEYKSIWKNEEPVEWEYEEFRKLYGRVEPSKEKVNQWRLSRLDRKSVV